MRVLLDTNVVLRLGQPLHAHHAIARAAAARLQEAGDVPCVVPQVVYEYWVVATRPAIENGLGFSPARAATDLDQLLESVVLLRDERAIYGAWTELVRAYDVAGKVAHDARLVAAMRRHGIRRLVTFNVADFRRFSGGGGITLIDPRELAS